jgi:hypothetical protein
VTRVGSQTPRLLSLPADIDNTDAGDEVIEFARRFGLELDPWQQWCVHHMLAERADGSWSATQSVLLVPRQCGKSALLEAIEMAALFLWDEQHIIYSAHLQKTATDHMRRIRRHIETTPDLKRMARVLTGKGDERVERRDTGAILEFITRGKKSSRGGSPNRVIFDEAMFLQDDEIQAMLPAMSAQSMNEDASAQMIYTSSAPIAESVVLHRLRDRALKDSPARTFFAEWSAPGDCNPADRENWYTANPGLGIRISEEWIVDNEFGTLSDEAFMVERLGVPIPPITKQGPLPKLDQSKWEASRTRKPYDVRPGACVLAFDVHLGWSSVAVGAGTLSASYGEVVEHRRGDGWLPERLAELVERWRPTAVGLDGGCGEAVAVLGVIREHFEAEGLDPDLVKPLTSAQYKAACGDAYQAVDNGKAKRPFVEPDQLHTAGELAAERRVGDAFVWDRRSASVPLSPLISWTIARSLLGERAAAETFWMLTLGEVT